MGPASTPGAGAAGAATATTAARAAAPVMGPGMVGVPMVPVGQAAGSAAANTGMMGALRNAASSTAGRVAAGGLRGALPGLGIALGGVQAGAALDQSNLLGGEDSKLNDSVSKMAKYGAAGAGGGLIVGGPVGALVGGVGGGVVGLIHEGLERQGILGTPSRTEQIDNFITEADNAAAQIGLPPEVTEALKTQYNAELMFADSKAEQLDLAQRYAQAMEEQVVAFATNPEQFQTAEQNDEAAMVSDFIRRSALINAIQPYANQMQAVSNATADSFENMAAGAGDLAPMYQAFADLQRQSGTRHAAGMMQDARMTPYMAALEQQASYLNQISQQTMQQAISGVMNPQTAAGSTDLTAIIDQATSQLQPN